jgi:hypothetical protein
MRVVVSLFVYAHCAQTRTRIPSVGMRVVAKLRLLLNP